MISTQEESRLARGQRALAAIDGEGGEKVVAALRDIAPDFADYLLEFPFGDIYCRPGLDLRAREIATIAALAALGNAAPQLRVHIAAGLNVGLNRQEIVEILMQMAVYAGFPAALNGLFLAKDLFHDLDERAAVCRPRARGLPDQGTWPIPLSHDHLSGPRRAA